MGLKVDTNSNRESALRTRPVAPRERLTALRAVRGAQLVEFALVLPLLLLLFTGLLDFATAYNLKHKLNNAAREGARLASSQGLAADLTLTNPPSVQVVRDAVVTYLNNAGVDTSFIGATMTAAGGFTWTYYSSGTYGLKIERAFPIPSGGGTILATRVTLNYPYNWSFGFNRLITFAVPSASYPATVSISTDATMQN